MYKIQRPSNRIYGELASDLDPLPPTRDYSPRGWETRFLSNEIPGPTSACKEQEAGRFVARLFRCY